MEASSKLKALKFMKRSAPNQEPTQEEKRIAEQRGKLAGDSRWRLDNPPVVNASKLTVVTDYSPGAAVQTSTESRKSFNLRDKRGDDDDEGDVDGDGDVNMEASKQRAHKSLAKNVEKKHQESVLQKAKQKYSSSLKKK